MSDKIIVTNCQQLTAKYGSNVLVNGVIAAKLTNLIRADKKRGIRTQVICLDDKNQMRSFGAPIVSKASNARQNKDSIDALYNRIKPDYLMLLGATDVIPHQPLNNTMPSDGDKYAYSDLPYACTTSFSRNPASFRAPTRVVGRVPDIVGGNDPSYLADLLDFAANYKSSPASKYFDYLGISAQVWNNSTALSLANTFGNSTHLNSSPHQGPGWTKKQLQQPMHFINCHGVSANPNFYGEQGSSYPISHSASIVSGNLAVGNVTAVECCYGAELYDPKPLSIHMALCNTYLASGSYGFFGSTTIAYGPPSGNGAADLITQYFLQSVLSGSSTGRAALEARQQFVNGANSLNPVDLKTLAQFYLLGDPSIHPVTLTQTNDINVDKSLMKGVSDKIHSFDNHRSRRRQQLVAKGLALLDSITYANYSKTIKVNKSISTALNQMVKNRGLLDVQLSSFNIKGGMQAKAFFKSKMPKTVYHLAEGKKKSPKKSPVNPQTAIIVEELDGKVISVREYQKR